MDIVIGSKTNPIATNNLIEDLNDLDVEGVLYTAYPILASLEGEVSIDAMLLSPVKGVIVFHFPTEEINSPEKLDDIEEQQNSLYFVISQKLREYKELRKGRELAFEPVVVSYIPTEIHLAKQIDLNIVGRNKLREFLENLPNISSEYFRPLTAAVQRVSTIKPAKKRVSVKKDDSKGAILKRIEKEIANLDRWQNHAAIESPEGPQCIRGLAGSGKTIVLALKAAYLHARNPEWTIAITFHTRSLYQQFTDLVRRFSYEHLRDEPDWNKLKILHSWGTKTEPGVYSEIASSYNLFPKTFGDAKSMFGREDAFSGLCNELLLSTGEEYRPIYDVLMIDEAQDFPQTFFKLVYKKAVTDPKRIIWAYDELQTLSDFTMLPPEELYGYDSKGDPNVSLRNIAGKPRQDIILPVCYRNTPWALATAHALGFGIYRDNGLVQLFNDPSESVWEKIGYEVLKGELSTNHEVSLSRRKDAAPEYFYELLDPKDAIISYNAKDATDQAKWVADGIYRNLTEDELEPSDILIILPDPIKVSDDANIIQHFLMSKGISSHIAGITSSKDVLFLENSVAITGIFRAKGNEAPVVYLLNGQYGYSGPELIRRRNTIFTAITRSKAWVRISGYGTGMENLNKEITAVKAADYRLNFILPSPDELAHLRRIYRDITDDERASIKKLKEVAHLLEIGEISPENVPPDLKEKIKKYLGG